MKHTEEITVYIHARKNWDETIKFTVDVADMSQYGWIMVLEKKVEIEFDLPPEFNIDAESIKAMRSEQKRINAEAHLQVTRLEERIQSLLCIEHKDEA